MQGLPILNRRLAVAAIEPGLFSSITIHRGMKSMDYLLQNPVRFDDAPGLSCLDLYKDFDVDRLIAIAGSTKILLDGSIEGAKSK